MNQQPGLLAFPQGFVWGASTAAYQIEGAVKEDGRGTSIWDTFSHTPGKIENGDTGDAACDHYHRYQEDIELMARLGLKAYRFSIAWPRILPQGIGAVNQVGLDFYDRLVDGLLAKGIQPFATLYHWDLPQPLQDAGGWPSRSSVEPFVNFVDVVSQRLGDRIHHWMTHNEPWVVAFLGHCEGVHAPGLHSWSDALLTAHHVLLSHGRAVPVLRANGDVRTEVGIVTNLSWVDPASGSPEDQAAARRHDGYANRWFLDALFKGSYPDDMLDTYRDIMPPGMVHDGDLAEIAIPLDFLGINYYSRAVVGAGNEMGVLAERTIRPEGEYTAMDWEVHPEGLYKLLTRVNRDYGPRTIYITENGAAFADSVAANGTIRDPKREEYLSRHLAQAHRAIQEGVPLRGYFVWSLLDNFEWAYGYAKRFGVTYVDYPTQQRIVKQSGEWYSQVIRQNGFVPRPN